MESRDSFTEEVVTAGNRPRVVVVEPDDERRRAIATALRKDGYDVLEERTAQGTLALFAEDVRAPDAVVGAGVELLVHLREHGWATPMIVRAGPAPARGDVIRWAPDAVLDEPIDVDALRQIMLDVLWPRRTLPSA